MATHTTPPPATPPTPTVQAAPSWLWAILIGICLLIAIIWWMSSCGENKSAPTTQTPAPDISTPAQKRAPTRVQTARQLSIGHPTPFGGMLYNFSENSGVIKVAVDVETATMVRFLPKGGKIKILRPDGTSYVDTPGVDIMTPKQVPGIFVITRAESSATGVEVNY